MNHREIQVLGIARKTHEMFERNNVEEGVSRHSAPDDCLSIIRGQSLCLSSSRFMPFSCVHGGLGLLLPKKFRSSIFDISRVIFCGIRI